MNTEEFRKTLHETGLVAHYDIGAPRLAAANLLILHNAATEAVEQWEIDNGRMERLGKVVANLCDDPNGMMYYLTGEDIDWLIQFVAEEDDEAT